MNERIQRLTLQERIHDYLVKAGVNSDPGKLKLCSEDADHLLQDLLYRIHAGNYELVAETVGSLIASGNIQEADALPLIAQTASARVTGLAIQISA